MALKTRFRSLTVCTLALWLAALAAAAEFHGVVKSGGLPLPGVTLTATAGDQKVVTTSDSQGRFSFPNLPDGIWNVEAGMLGFEKAGKAIQVVPGVLATEWDLKLLSEQALLTQLALPAPPAGPARAERATPATPATPAARTAERARTAPRNSFERLTVTQSTDSSTLSSEGALKTGEVADLNQSAANSFLIQGSVSSALGMAQQNDWGFGPGGPGMMGAGGPGGMMGAGSPGGDGPGFGPQMGARGGRGGGGGMMMGGGGPGGPGGGFGGPAGGPGMMGGGGRGGWMGRPNARAFGNARRDFRNQYMGAGYLNFGNSALDARSFSVTGSTVDKPSYNSLRAGFMFGGPLYIPKLISREKRIQFNLNVEIQNNRTGQVSNPVNMPTSLERTGDFSQSLLQGAAVGIVDPTTGLLFPGNKIPASRISPTALSLLQYFPTPNLPNATQNYQVSLVGSTHTHNINSRVSNIKLDSKDRLNTSLGYQGGNSTTSNLFGFTDSGANRGINAGVGWSRNITTRLINNLQFNFSRSRQLSSPYFADLSNVASALGIQGTSQNPLNWGPPNLSFTNYGSLTDGNYSSTRNQTASLNDSLLIVHGSHNITVGGEYRRQQFNQLSDSNGRGTYSFNGSITGFDLADFLLGTPTTGSIRYGNPDKYFRGAATALFVNDDWRVSSRFTLLAGLRWDYSTPLTELYNRLVNLSIAPGFSAISAVQAGQSGSYSNALIHPDYNNFSPRFGFAWRPSTAHSMVVRGGYGIYYNTSVYSLIASNMAQQPPFAQVLNVSNSAATPLTIANGFLLATSQSNTSTYAIDPNYRIGYAQSWTLSVQHELPLSLIGTIGYLGTKGTRLDQQLLPNSTAPGAVESALPHGYIYETSNGDSIYHAAQFQLNRRFHSGIMAHANYQFSKSIDNAGTGGRGQGNTPVAQNWLDLAAERGLSSFDARHNLSVTFQYSSGMGRAGGTLVNGWKGALMKDWTISGTTTLRSGNPFTATAGGSRSQVSGTAVGNTVRAESTGLPVSVDGMLFNTAAFTSPVPGFWGDAGRNTIPGPTTFSLNGSFGRVFRLGERRSIDLQLQSQNLLNHVTITNWGTVLDSATYGLATSAAQMRKITLSLRFRF